MGQVAGSGRIMITFSWPPPARLEAAEPGSLVTPVSAAARRRSRAPFSVSGAPCLPRGDKGRRCGSIDAGRPQPLHCCVGSAGYLSGSRRRPWLVINHCQPATWPAVTAPVSASKPPPPPDPHLYRSPSLSRTVSQARLYQSPSLPSPILIPVSPSVFPVGPYLSPYLPSL